MENIISSEICEKCAECCKKYPFVEVSKKEIHLLELLSGLHCDIFAYPIGKVVEDYFLQFQENGDCFFLNEINGIYACGVYEARPGICKNYPSKPRQKKTCIANRSIS